MDHLYSGINEPKPKIIDVFICKLRKKLAAAAGGDKCIETVWGRGYRLGEPLRNEGGHTAPSDLWESDQLATAASGE